MAEPVSALADREKSRPVGLPGPPKAAARAREAPIPTGTSTAQAWDLHQDSQEVISKMKKSERSSVSLLLRNQRVNSGRSKR